MSSYAAAHLAIETRMDSLWTDDSVSIRYENESRKIPAGDWIRFSIRTLRGREVGFSAGKILYRRPGIIWAQCFVQAKTGTQRARIIADAVIDIFEGKSFSGITCDVSELSELGDDGEGFWQVNAKIFFDHDFERTY